MIEILPKTKDETFLYLQVNTFCTSCITPVRLKICREHIGYSRFPQIWAQFNRGASSSTVHAHVWRISWKKYTHECKDEWRALIHRALKTADLSRVNSHWILRIARRFFFFFIFIQESSKKEIVASRANHSQNCLAHSQATRRIIERSDSRKHFPVKL